VIGATRQILCVTCSFGSVCRRRYRETEHSNVWCNYCVSQVLIPFESVTQFVTVTVTVAFGKANATIFFARVQGIRKVT
jgi:hypothetical protein